MRVLVTKMNKFGVLKFQMIVGAIVMLAAMVVLPVSILAVDSSLLLNPFIIGVVLVGMLMFGSFAYFLFMRPYIMYRKAPEVLAETDGEFVYLYDKKQEKIPISAFADATVTHHYPFIFSNETISVFLVHLFSEKYGDLTLDVPGYGSYRLRFVADVKKSKDELLGFLRTEMLLANL